MGAIYAGEKRCAGFFKAYITLIHIFLAKETGKISKNSALKLTMII